MLPELVKVCADIAGAASEDGEAREAALWHVLRHLDKRGQGWVSLVDLRAFCQGTGYQSERTLRRILSRGEGSWWLVNGWAGRVEYRSLARVCMRLRTVPGVSLMVALDKLKGRGMRAVGLAGFLASRDGLPVKVSTVEQVTGLGARGQQRCRAHLGIERVKNVGCQGWYKQGEVVEGSRWFYRGQVYRWLACSWTGFQAVKNSHARKVARAVRGAVGQMGDGHRGARLYWTDLARARKSRNKGPLAWVRRERQHGGAVVWDAI